MASEIPPNPYLAQAGNDVESAPFAGRQKAFEFLYQQLTDPAGTETNLIMGRHGIGKTALLKHFNRFFDETLVGVYIPLQDRGLAGEADWLKLLVDGPARALAERNYTLSRLPEFDGAAADMRRWFSETYLPEMVGVIRRHRRLVFLLDNANVLLKAMDDGHLPDDSIQYLHSLVQSQFGPGVVLTLDTRYESDIARFSPLVQLEDVFRLANLSEDEAKWLLNEPAAERYRLTPEAVSAVYAATGGQPRALQQFGYQLFKLWESRPNHDPFTLDDVKQVTPTIYAQSEADLRAAWAESSRNERLALTAISSLIYSDPLAAITPERIESWLIETDYPLDATAINAAIRGLEYREMIEHTPAGVRLTAGLTQRWLLENARLTEAAPQGGTRGLAFRWLAVGVIAIVAILLVLTIRGGDAPPTSSHATLEPTVTLVTNP
jgi:hypothetical protein